MSKSQRAPRPVKGNEYEILLVTRAAQKGWGDLCAVRKNDMANAWDFLTRTPTQEGPTNYRLRGALSTVTRDDQVHEVWQHKPSSNWGARLWFYIEGRVVKIFEAHTHHPNETK